MENNWFLGLGENDKLGEPYPCNLSPVREDGEWPRPRFRGVPRSIFIRPMFRGKCITSFTAVTYNLTMIVIEVKIQIWQCRPEVAAGSNSTSQAVWNYTKKRCKKCRLLRVVVVLTCSVEEVITIMITYWCVCYCLKLRLLLLSKKLKRKKSPKNIFLRLFVSLVLKNAW